MSSIPFTSFNGLLVVRRAEAEVETQQGLHIPEAARETLNHGEVVAVPQTGANENPFSVGEKVMWARGTETVVEVGGNHYLLIHFNDILVRIDE